MSETRPPHEEGVEKRERILFGLRKLLDSHDKKRNVRSALSDPEGVSPSQIARMLFNSGIDTNADVVLESLQELPRIGNITDVTTKITISDLKQSLITPKIAQERKGLSKSPKYVDPWTNHIEGFIGQYPDGVSSVEVATQFGKSVQAAINNLDRLVSENKVEKKYEKGARNNRIVRYFIKKSAETTT